MILGIGTDVLKIARVGNALSSRAFLRRTFTTREQARAAATAEPARHLAALFAGKEACFKALSLPPDALRDWREIEIDADGTGARLHGALALAGQGAGLAVLHLVLSLGPEQVSALALAEGGNDDVRH